MQLPSQGLRYEYSVALVMSFWLTRIGYIMNELRELKKGNYERLWKILFPFQKYLHEFR